MLRDMLGQFICIVFRFAHQAFFVLKVIAGVIDQGLDQDMDGLRLAAHRHRFIELIDDIHQTFMLTVYRGNTDIELIAPG